MNAPPDDHPSLELILYRLDELKGTVERGFSRADTRLDRLDERVAHLETWRAAEEVRDQHRAVDIEHATESGSAVTGPDWIKVVLALVALVGAALTIIAQHGG